MLPSGENLTLELRLVLKFQNRKEKELDNQTRYHMKNQRNIFYHKHEIDISIFQIKWKYDKLYRISSDIDSFLVGKK